MILFSSSGTAAVESAFANLLSPGDRILVVSAGNFGERWVKMGEAYRADVEVLRSPWGTRPDPAAVAERVNGRDDLAAVFVVHSETSTGATADVRGDRAADGASRSAASWSTPSRRSARRRSRPTRGGSTSSSPARRRR